MRNHQTHPHQSDAGHPPRTGDWQSAAHANAASQIRQHNTSSMAVDAPSEAGLFVHDIVVARLFSRPRVRCRFLYTTQHLSWWPSSGSFPLNGTLQDAVCQGSMQLNVLCTTPVSRLAYAWGNAPAASFCINNFTGQDVFLQIVVEGA